MMETPMRPPLLILRTGRRELREYLLRPIAEHFRVHMFLGLDPTWELEYVTGTTTIANTLDIEAMVIEAKRLHQQEPFAGVLTWDESRTPQAAGIAAALGLPGGDVDAIARVRDKHLTRLALDAAGVPQPRSIQVASLDEALVAAETIGYPVIVKPADLALSIGVQRVETPDELTAAYQVTSALKVRDVPDHRMRVLIEEYAIGEEISVDCAVFHGKVSILCLARKQIGFAPHCVEIGHYVDGNDPLLRDPAMLRLMEETHAALGFNQGVTHTEIMMTATGPKIIEVNGRLGGDLIPYLGLRATGVDTGVAAAMVAADLPPVISPDRRLVAGVRFMHVDADDTLIGSIRFDERDLPASVDELVLLAAPGDRYSTAVTAPLNCRIAYAIAVAETIEEVLEGLSAAEHALVVTVTED